MGTSGSKVDNCFLCVFGDKADVNQPEQHLRTDPAVEIDSSGSSSGHDGSGMGSTDVIYDAAYLKGDDTSMSSTTGGRTVDIRNGALRLAGIAPPAGDNLRMTRISRAAAAGNNSRLLKSPEPAGDSRAEEEGMESFFFEGDRFAQDLSWRQARHAPSLAELLGRVERLGNVNMALSEVRVQQDQENRREATVRKKVMKRFLEVMGPDSPGLQVKKCHRGGGRASAHYRYERVRWAPRVIRFESAGNLALRDGTPLGGSIAWNSRRLFPRERPKVEVADIVKVEQSGKYVWIKADGDEGKLGLETKSSADAKFLCRSIDFLVSAALQLCHAGQPQQPVSKHPLREIKGHRGHATHTPRSSDEAG